jgi:hypothetical protein
VVLRTHACSVHTRVNATFFTASQGRISRSPQLFPRSVEHSQEQPTTESRRIAYLE